MKYIPWNMLSFIQSGSLSKCVIDTIQMSNSMLGVTYARSVKHETRAGRPKFVVSGKCPTMTRSTRVKARICARVFHFSETRVR